MATDFSRLFIAPKWDRPEPPQLDFYNMLGGIGEGLLAARERARQHALRTAIKDGLPHRADGSIDYDATADLAARTGYLPGVKDFATLGLTARRMALRPLRLAEAQSQTQVPPPWLAQGGAPVPSFQMPDPFDPPLRRRDPPARSRGWLDPYRAVELSDRL